ncbi:MAG: hypothetical protein E7475_08140 [Ruminococcaceae bacterium]|nr:hypothetical protein [Oscillospiraceae bacterium]
MIYPNNTAEVLERGMDVLLEQLGPVEAERFIAVIIRERFDYTKWRRNLFGNASVEEINTAAAEYGASHPFTPKRAQIEV